MTTCDPSRRPDQATQQMALEVVRRFVTIGSFGAADAVHDLAADAGCPACAMTSVTQLMLAVVAAVTGHEYVTEELSGRILALINAAQAELDAAADWQLRWPRLARLMVWTGRCPRGNPVARCATTGPLWGRCPRPCQ